jgi:hypothetical protein
MNDDRFIELVNLYIDRQITVTETAELEAEIQASPRRRATYRRYCQMHRATTLVQEGFRAQASAQPVGQSLTPGPVTPFAGGRRNSRFRWTYYAGGLAAAACLELIFGRLNIKPSAEINLLAQTNSQSLPVIRAVPAPADNAAARATPVTEPPHGLVSLRNSAADYAAYSAVLAAPPADESRAFTPGRGRADGLSSLFEDGVFESQQVMPVRNQRIFRGKQTPAQQAEFTAFQFQR